MWTYMMAAARGDRATSIIQARNARYQNDDSNLSRWVFYGWVKKRVENMLYSDKLIRMGVVEEFWKAFHLKHLKKVKHVWHFAL